MSSRTGPVRRSAALGLLLVALIGAVIPASADPRADLEANERKQDKLRAQIADATAKAEGLLTKVQSVDADRSAVERQVAVLDARLGQLRDRIRRVRAELERAQIELAGLEGELSVVLAQLEARRSALAAHAVAAYKAGPTAYLDSLLSAESFGDLVDRYSYLENILDADARLIDEIEALQFQIEAKQTVVETKRADIAERKLGLEADEAVLAQVRGTRAALLAELEGSLAAKQGLLAQVEASKQRYEQILEQLERESAQIEQMLSGGSSGSGPAGTGQLVWPANGPVTSGYGYRTHPIFGDRRFHSGIDIGAGYGSPAWSGDRGQVVFAGVMSGYGNVVVVDHGGGLATTYNHLSGFAVGSGQAVGRGQQVGYVGCSGYCTGPHLHFEVRINGDPVDPMPYLQ